MPDFFDDSRPHDGLTYEDYRAYWREEKDVSPDAPDADERRRLHYLNYNWERQAHVHEEYTPSEELRTTMREIEEPQLWMVLTEPWCGDSAFLLPVIAEAASLGDPVSLRILLRDENLDVMDQYLTDGSRSIPKLVAFHEDGTELYTWGPRPREAGRLFDELRARYDDKMEVIEHLLSHYQDGGWRDADDELAETVQVGTPSLAVEAIQ